MVDIQRLALSAEMRKAREAWPVALVSMPFFASQMPSIQLGLLKSIGSEYGFPTQTLHLNLDFAQQIGQGIYESISASRGPQIGDWLFSVAAFRDQAPDPEGRLLDQIGAVLQLMQTPAEQLHAVRNEAVPRYLDKLMEVVPWGQHRVVGFSCTFQQTVASIALARRIKEKFPHIQIVFGGSSFEDEMGLELVAAIDCIDYAVIGEGDRAFPELLIALQTRGDAAGILGVTCRRDEGVVFPGMQPLAEDLNALPTPDYDEYFARAQWLATANGQRLQLGAVIPLESSRGCWWGQKQRCTFCGLNGTHLAYRHKSCARVLDEIAHLIRRHGLWTVAFTDNVFPLDYMKEMIKRLNDQQADYVLSYEMRPNLGRSQIREVVRAGIRQVQLGIESLNTHVLKLMRKGVTAAQNVNALRWARYYGLTVNWNLLWGFPGETEADYSVQASLFPRITHLQPAGSCFPIWMEHFSPVFVDRHAFPVRYIRPHFSYAYVYPRHVDLERVAYFYDYQFVDSLPEGAYEETRRQLRLWQEAWKDPVLTPMLTYWYAPGLLHIEDRRDAKTASTQYTFQGVLPELYKGCSDAPLTAGELQTHLRLDLDEEEIRLALEEFCTQGLMMREGECYLSLALPATQGR
jgi:ribosomal peptide maturation radical SAM protein 1